MECLKCKKFFARLQVIDDKKRNLSGRKFCTNCSPFGKHNNIDLTKESSRCNMSRDERRVFSNRKKYRKWQKKFRKQRKEKLIAIMGGGCQKCGYNKCIAALQFHHRDGEHKSFEIGTHGLTSNWDKLIKEVSKCDMLCSNCHIEYHYAIHCKTPEGKPR